MKLFKLVNYKLVIEDEVYLLTHFKAIIDRDRSKDKSTALAELSYIWFMADRNSDFRAITDMEERSREVIKSLPLPVKWRPDDLINAAIAFYKDREYTVADYILEDAEKGINEIRKFLREADLSKTINGKPVYNAKQFIDTMKQLSGIIKEHQELKDLVKKEIDQRQGFTKGGRKRGLFENQ